MPVEHRNYTFPKQATGERDGSNTLIEGGASPGDPFRIFALSQIRPRGVIIDVDDTLYRNVAYRRAVAQREFQIIGEALGWPVGEEAARVRTHRSALSERLGREARLTETVHDLGLSQEWWDQARERVYRPEDFLAADPAIAQMLLNILDSGVAVAVASNTPSGVVKRVLTALGVPEVIKERIHVFGPDTVGVAKPDPEYFRRIAERLGISPEACLSLGDDEQNDAHPAISLGMGSVLVSRPGHIGEAADLLLAEDQYQPFDIERFAGEQFRPGKISILGFTGRAGAGKTTIAQQLHEHYTSRGIPSAIVGLDAFFRLSSRERKAWLEEGKLLGEEEHARRSDQASWWEFEKASEVLDMLRRGESVHLSGIYNRADGGELTGELHIEPDPAGMVVILEGVATAHLKKDGDHFVYVNAHPTVRRGRLLGRDQDRRGTTDAAYERFLVTQGFENDYFPQWQGAIDTVLENSGSILTRVPAMPLL